MERCRHRRARGRHGARGPGATGHLRNREGAPAGNRGVPGLLEYREVAARGAPAPRARTPHAPHPYMHSGASTPPAPLTPHSIFALIAN